MNETIINRSVGKSHGATGRLIIGHYARAEPRNSVASKVVEVAAVLIYGLAAAISSAAS